MTRRCERCDNTYSLFSLKNDVLVFSHKLKKVNFYYLFVSLNSYISFLSSLSITKKVDTKHNLCEIKNSKHQNLLTKKRVFFS